MNSLFDYLLISILCLTSLVLIYLIFAGRNKKTDERDIPSELKAVLSEMKNAKQDRSKKAQMEINLEDQEITKTKTELSKLEQEKDSLDKAIKNKAINLNIEHVRLFASINNLGFGVIIVDKEKNIRFLNKSAKIILDVQKLKNSFNVNDTNAMLTKIDTASKLDDVMRDINSYHYNDVGIKDKLYDVFISSISDGVSKTKETKGALILIKDKTEERLLKRSKENFFIIASHELRTPLTGIRGYVQILKTYYYSKIGNQELIRMLNDIDESSARLINIVNDFLDKSKFEEDKISIKLAACDIIAIIKSSIQDTILLAKEKKLGIIFENSISDAFVFGDKDRIKQILINLLSNSIKYSEKGLIKVQMEHTADEKYKISISDNGNGIPDENVELLFSKYQQINTKKGANVVSTGLGLYISKLLAEKMNGNLRLERTKLGEGSTFSLSLPVYHNNL